MTGKYNRQKGHNFERKVCADMREDLGFEDAMTSRAGDRSLDDAGVDILNCQPWAIQCHASAKMDLKKFDDLCKFTKQEGGYNVPIYAWNRKGKPEVVVMLYDDWRILARDIMP